MRFVIQVVKEASVKVGGETIGQIGKGYLVLIGVSDSDTEAVADKMIRKMTGLRIFADENGKTNLSLADVGGSLPSLPFTRTARRGTAPALSRRERRIKRRHCMSISSGSAGRQSRMYRPGSLGRRWK